jgi:hypothetical protein
LFATPKKPRIIAPSAVVVIEGATIDVLVLVALISPLCATTGAVVSTPA